MGGTSGFALCSSLSFSSVSSSHLPFSVIVLLSFSVLV